MDHVSRTRFAFSYAASPVRHYELVQSRRSTVSALPTSRYPRPPPSLSSRRARLIRWADEETQVGEVAVTGQSENEHEDKGFGEQRLEEAEIFQVGKDEYGAEGISREEALEKQLNFWFSTLNLRFDDFMLERMDSNGNVPVSVLLTFNRIKSIHTSAQEIVAAAESSQEIIVTRPENLDESADDYYPSCTIRRAAGMEFLGQRDEYMDLRTVVAFSFPTSWPRLRVFEFFSQFGSLTFARVPRTRLLRLTERCVFVYEEASAAQKVLDALETDLGGFPINTSSDQLDVEKPPCSIFRLPTWESLKPGELSDEASLHCTVVRLGGISRRPSWQILFDKCSENNREVRYLTLSPNCEVRFGNREDAENFLSQIDDERKNNKTSLKARFLTRQEDLEYWTRAFGAKKGRNGRNDGRIVSIGGIVKSAPFRDLFDEIMTLEHLVYLAYETGQGIAYARMVSAESAKILAEKLSIPGRTLCGDEIGSAEVLSKEGEAEYWKDVDAARKAQDLREDDQDEGSESSETSDLEKRPQNASLA